MAALDAAAMSVTLAVKNGPPGMWRSLGEPVQPLGPLLTSPLWLVGTICVLVALAPSAFRAAKMRGLGPLWALLLTAGAVGLLIEFGLLLSNVGLAPLIFVVLVVAWVWVKSRALRRRARASSQAGAIIDLGHWRESRRPRRHVGS